eukprot:7295315-Prymnesium_polylepis.1
MYKEGSGAGGLRREGAQIQMLKTFTNGNFEISPLLGFRVLESPISTDGPALAVRPPRAHSPLQHGTREPDADHTSDRPPCVAGLRPSMRSAVRAHAHRSRSSRTL